MPNATACLLDVGMDQGISKKDPVWLGRLTRDNLCNGKGGQQIDNSETTIMELCVANDSHAFYDDLLLFLCF